MKEGQTTAFPLGYGMEVKCMTEKAAETRQRNMEAMIAKSQAEAAAKRAATAALQRVFEHPEATPEQILEAARLLAELGGR